MTVIQTVGTRGGEISIIRRKVINHEMQESWSAELAAYLDQHHALFLDWANGTTRVDAESYDRSIYGLIDVIQPYALIGWHCTRLTDPEIARIISEGMELPSVAMLTRRIEAMVEASVFSVNIGDRLKATNQAHESNRAGKIWFCFFRPGLAGERGVGDLFRF